MASATKTFEYAVRDGAGQLVSGQLEAANEAALVARLKQMGYAPLTVRETGTGLNREISLSGLSRRVSLKDVAIMSRQFATMIAAGLSLVRALAILEEQTESARLTTVLRDVRGRVEAGGSLSGALAEHADVFPPLMVSMCRAGELGGFLDRSLLQVAASLEADVRLRGKIKAAMTYPVVVMVFAVVATVAMLLFIVPVFAEMYAGFGAALPLPTRVLLVLSGLLRVLAPLVVVLVVVAGVLWRKVRRHPRVRDTVEPLALKVPVFGPLARKVAVARFCRNLAAMLRAGVPVLQSLKIVGDTSGNVVLERASAAISESVQRGEGLSPPMAGHPVFPSMVVQMVTVGEDTGATDDMLDKLADFYDEEVETTTEQLTSLIEPLMIVVIGALVGGMVICLYLPMFGIYDVIQ